MPRIAHHAPGSLRYQIGSQFIQWHRSGLVPQIRHICLSPCNYPSSISSVSFSVAARSSIDSKHMWTDISDKCRSTINKCRITALPAFDRPSENHPLILDRLETPFLLFGLKPITEMYL